MAESIRSVCMENIRKLSRPILGTVRSVMTRDETSSNIEVNLGGTADFRPKARVFLFLLDVFLEGDRYGEQ